MAALRIVYSLLKVPKLFASLLLFPIAGALIIVVVQLLFTASALNQISNANNLDSDNANDSNWNVLRLILFSNPYPLTQDPIICVWDKDPMTGHETFPSSQCAPDRLDVALSVSNNTDTDFQKYLKILKGNALRLHICSECRPDLRIVSSYQHSEVQISSVYGLMLYQLIIKDEDKESSIREIRKEITKDKKNLGEVLISLPNLKNPVNFSTLDISLATTLNITALAVIALWLGLKAHRKVLEYFSKSGALLPMVAVTGKSSFYGALWMITALRVFAFLAASVPLLIFTLTNSYASDSVQTVDIKSAYFLLWISALFSSLCLATIIASMADLKARHELLSILYKLVPLFLSLIGAFIWAITFFGTSNISALVRSFLTCIPILGLGPVIFSQIVQPPAIALLIQVVLSLAACSYLLKKNTHWFAAHLEEI